MTYAWEFWTHLWVAFTLVLCCFSLLSFSPKRRPWLGFSLYMTTPPSDSLHTLVVVAYSLSHAQFFCNPMDCSMPGSSVHGIFQARILEWVAISFSRGSCWPRNWTQVSWILMIEGKKERAVGCEWLWVSKSQHLHQRTPELFLKWS